MVPDRAGALIDLLREHRLLDPAQLEELTRTPDVLDTDPQVLGKCLVELGWLTPFQVDRLLHGRPQDLFLGAYQLLDRLGQSEVGPTFQARKPGKAGTVTLKIIPKPRIGDAQRLALFQQEVRTAAQLQHPNIAPVVAVGQQGTLFLFAREFVPGADLGRLVRELGPLPVTLACKAAHQAALALQHAHDKGLSHRRVKAFNLIAVDQAEGESTVKLVDFGLGLLKPSAVPGLDVAGDLAALGQTLSFLLTGQVGPGGSDSLPPEVREMIRRLDAGAEDRFHTAWEAAQALEPLGRESPPEPAPVPVNGVAPAAEPAEVPVATATAQAVPFVAEQPAPVEPEPATVAMAVPLEGIAVPVVGLAVEPTVAPSLPEPEGAAVFSATAAPEALAEAAPVDAVVTASAPEVHGWQPAGQDEVEPAVAPPSPAEPLPVSHAVEEPPALAAPVAFEEAPAVAPPPPDPPAPLEAPWVESAMPNLAAEHQPTEVAPPSPSDLAPWQTAPPPVEVPPPPAEPYSFSAASAASVPYAPAPEPTPGGAGYFMDQPAPSPAEAEPDAGPPMGSPFGTGGRAPTKRKWSKKDYLLLAIGTSVWIVVIILVVVVVIIRANRSEAPPKKNNRPAAPAKEKSRERASRGSRPALSNYG